MNCCCLFLHKCYILFIADTKKSVLKTMAAMDLDKINMDLVESLLEWIVDGKHNYPPGENHPCILFKTLLEVSMWTFK